VCGGGGGAAKKSTRLFLLEVSSDNIKDVDEKKQKHPKKKRK
jgi:hypothetical protein